jgi:hypothetical protein
MSYIGAEPDGMGKAQRFTYTSASGGETVVSADDDGVPIGYTSGQVSVFLNGVKLVVGTDCIATNGSTITGLSALAASDVVEVVALSIFSATTVEGADIISTGVTGTSKYLRVDGDGTSSWQTVPHTEYNDDVIQTNIAMLGFKVAVNGSLAKYNLQDQVIDEYTNATGIDATPSTNHVLASGVYSGEASSNLVKEFASSDASYTIGAASLFTKIIVVGAGGSGGTNSHTGTNQFGSGAGGGGYIVGINYTSPAGATTVNATVGTGGAKTGTTGNVGGTSSVVFGSDLTLTAGGGGAGVEDGAAGGGGAGSKSGTSSAATSTLALAGGNGGAGVSLSAGTGGNHGGTGTLDSVSYQSSGGGGGGSGAATGGTGGNGLAASFTGGGGGGGNDLGSGTTSSGGSGYKTAGIGGAFGGTEDAEDATVDSTTVTGATGGTAVTGNERPHTNAGGGAFAGGGGGGGGDGGFSGTGNAGDGGKGYIRLEYTTYTTGDLVLQSTDTTAEAAPTKADMVMLMEDTAGTATLNTDIKGFVSRDSGSTFIEGTLVDEGDWGTNKRILAFHDLSFTGASGTAMCYKITTHNQSASKKTKIHATSIGWR